MRAALAPSRPPTTAMDRTRSPRSRAPSPTAVRTPLARTPHPSHRRPTPRLRFTAILLLTGLIACAAPPEASAPPPHPGASLAAGSPAASGLTRTANHDARGAGMQPDYDGEAASLREHMRARLPDPLPSDRRLACTAMLDAAVAFYGSIESTADARTRLLAALEATRPDDLRHCQRDTSLRAALCVQLRLSDRDAELPWLLDQCTRAFPD